MLFLLYNKI